MRTSSAPLDMGALLCVVLLASLLSPATARAGCLPATIQDNAYIGILDGNDGTGTDAGMVCCDDERLNQFPGTVRDVNVSLAVSDHLWIGDLVAKVKSPSGTLSTVFSRPDYAEAADDGSGCCGSSNDWLGSMLLFDEQSGGPSAETLGAVAGAVCSGNGICEYTPDQDTGPGSGLDVDFDGETYVGLWEVCLGDAVAGYEGVWSNYNLEIVIDRSIPCLCADKFRGGDRVRYVGSGSLPVGIEGEVMCGNNTNLNSVLASWDGWAGHSGNGHPCNCPGGSIPNSDGWWVKCADMEFVLPYSDNFETGNFIRWSSVQAGGV